jgi:hypothetical protein
LIVACCLVGCGSSPEPAGLADGGPVDAAALDVSDGLKDEAWDLGIEAVLPESDASEDLSGSRDVVSADGQPEPVGDASQLPTTCSGPRLAEPVTITFQLRNRGLKTVYLHRSCGAFTMRISSCQSAYSDSVGPEAACGCATTDGGISMPCGPCAPMAATAITENGARAERWHTVQVEKQAGGACGAVQPVPSGTYRATFFVFDSEPPIGADVNSARQVTVEFVLPRPMNYVNVRLNAPTADAGPGDAP